MHRCAVCTTPVRYEDSVHYVLGPMRGRLCLECQAGLSAVVGEWLARRTRRAAQEAEQVPRGLRAVGGGR